LIIEYIFIQQDRNIHSLITSYKRLRKKAKYHISQFWYNSPQTQKSPFNLSIENFKNIHSDL